VDKCAISVDNCGKMWENSWKTAEKCGKTMDYPDWRMK
jgi:hypothetical protein